MIEKGWSMIPRRIESKMLDMAAKFPIVSLTGPRQSGKSTLLKESFAEYRYVSLEDPDVRAFAYDDPRSFLKLYDNHVVIDEAQNAPDLFSYLQSAVDKTGDPGQYILSGSQNFLMMQHISQSLAGRVAVFKLLPFSYRELAEAGRSPSEIEDWMWTGGYPRIYDRDINPNDYFPHYVQTYLDRDVRQLGSVRNLTAFNAFVRLCAANIGGIMNITSLANTCDIDVKTAREWLSILETSYLVFRLPPYHKNFGKRLAKRPKLYFYDTGLACNLLGIQAPERLRQHEKRGALYENAVIAELMKRILAQGRSPELYYWRDANQKEVDLLIDENGMLSQAWEIKSSATYKPSQFSTLESVASLANLPPEHRSVVYAGNDSFETKHGTVMTLADIDKD